MRLARLQVENFRNFRAIDVRLGQHVVLLGENGVGKTNLLRALRLLLDASLPDSERQLEAEDFWGGIAPFAGARIEIKVDVAEYDEEPALLALLDDYEVKTPPGGRAPVARLNYRFAPKTTIDPTDYPSTKRTDYEWIMFGGDDPSNELDRMLRRDIGFRVLPALRDAASDLRAWRTSPLRPLLETAKTDISAAKLKETAQRIDQAGSELASEAELKALGETIRARLNLMIGTQHEVVPTFGFASTDPARLIRSLRLFVDPARRWGVEDASLGLANALYLALLMRNAEQEQEQAKTAAMLLGIEEPEAHLHPQLQRLVFRDLLRRSQPVLVSTHSPNIASVAPLDALVVIRGANNESTVASVAGGASFTSREVQDLTRYLDVTRAEIVFGRGVILVEGDAEEFIVPAAARCLPKPVDLDEYGITVCSVAGADFIPYVKLLYALRIPYVVITDGDAKDATKASTCPGFLRGTELMAAVSANTLEVASALAKGDGEAARKSLSKAGVFVGARTLESDLIAAGAGAALVAAYKDLVPRPQRATLESFLADGPVDDARERKIIGLIEEHGKGRFAQRLGSHLGKNMIPSYIAAGIAAIVERVQRNDGET